MQNQDFKFLLENAISTKQMAKHLQVTEDVIEELCEKEILEAKYLNNRWAILKNQELPCLVQFKNVDGLNKDNYNILNGNYDMEDLEELAYWPIKLIEDDYYIGFQNICIDKGVFKDPSGKLHTKYVLEIETFLNVSSWDVSLNTILFEVDYATSPKKSEFVAVFENEADAFKCANKLYPEFPIEEVIIEEYPSKFSFYDDILY